ncbi:MAG TPA: phosphotransferase [Acidimicrobiales bacterium]|nr:phosphotransferase [Acidimicrobiales bacterium]
MTLAGGGDHAGLVVRIGDTVHRPSSPATPAVRELLTHLADAGFDGAPRFVGLDDEGREVLSYVDGAVPVPPRPPLSGWLIVDERAVGSVGALLRRYHDAVAGFGPPPDAPWQGGPPEPFAGDVVCHNDPVVGNVVFRRGVAVALLDFDYAGPGDPIWDVAVAAQHWVPLADPIDFVGGGADMVGGRLDRFLRDYGRSIDRDRLFDAVDAYLERGRRSVEARVAASQPVFVEYWEAGLGDRLLRARAWVAEHRTRLS